MHGAKKASSPHWKSDLNIRQSQTGREKGVISEDNL